jgi:O6-methylguanine-DNA--protein-cysteine methyltransferase
MQATQSESQQIISLLKRLVRNTDRIANAMECGRNTNRSAKASENQRVALAVVAIARGASTYQEIADELGVSRGTVSKNPGIRRAMESAVRDRRPESKEAAEDYRWNK